MKCLTFIQHGIVYNDIKDGIHLYRDFFSSSFIFTIVNLKAFKCESRVSYNLPLDICQ